ncbi:hypothetical protein PFLmoz3_02819 [Pseudomonas fluorescens]|uniref:Uncharacterized protein n=1 Tax=Pseudomonas fluorescens TaxID=294 RepID=A0A120G7N5_PSEFL|nr:hypothetical protein PFLmoz3_02819 [Pseudomonas fluorescens]
MRGSGLGIDANGERLTQGIGQATVDLAWVLAFARGHFRGQQGRDQAVLVGTPHAAVLAQERGTGAFFAAKPQRPLKQAIGKPFEAHWHFVQATADARRDAVDQAAADHGLAHGRIGTPVRAVLEQIVDGHRQVVVGRQQTTGRRDDAVAVVVRVAGEGNVETLLETDQALHGIAGGRVHANLAVPVDAHEAKGGVDLGIHHLQVQTVVLGNRRPVAHPCSAQRIHAQAQVGAADRVHVDHIDQVGHIAVEVVMAMGGVGLERLGVSDALDPGQLVGEQFVGLGFDPLGDVSIGWATVRRVVLVAATLRRVVRRCNHNAVRQAAGTAPVIADDGVGNRRRRRVLVALGQHHVHAVGRQYFQGAGTGWRRQCMGIQADKQGAGNALSFAVQANGLADSQHMPLVETQFERTATVPGGTKSYALSGDRCIRLAGVVGRDQSRDIHQQLGWCRLARKRTDSHA